MEHVRNALETLEYLEDENLIAFNLQHFAVCSFTWTAVIYTCLHLQYTNKSEVGRVNGGVDAWTTADLIHGVLAIFSFDLHTHVLSRAVQLQRLQFHAAYHIVFVAAFCIYGKRVVIATALHVAMLLQATTMAAAGVADDAGSSAADALLSFAIEQSLANYGALSGPAIWMMYCLTGHYVFSVGSAYKGAVALSGCAAYFTAIDAGLVSIPAEHRPTWLKHALVGVGVEMWVVVVVFVTPRLVEFVKRTSRFIVGSNDAAAATKSKAECLQTTAEYPQTTGNAIEPARADPKSL
eukprot:gene17042-14926_t